MLGVELKYRDKQMAHLRLMCIVVLTATTVAQNTSSKASTASSSARLAPFNPQLDSLPPRFAANDADAIYGLIKAKFPSPSKSEFESEAEYRARTEELASKPLLGGTKASDLFAFVLTGMPSAQAVSADLEEVFRNVDTSYNAEFQQLTVTLSSYTLAPTDDQPSLLWRTSSTLQGAYVGSNALGVKKRVSRWEQDDTIISLHDLSWLSPDCAVKFGDISCAANVDAGTARLLSRNLRVLIVGHLVAPFISAEKYVGEPTIDAPAEIHHFQKVLHVQIEQLWLVDGMTGRVIEKYSKEKHAAEYPVNVELRLRDEGTFSYPDPRCNEYGSRGVSLDYSIDGATTQSGYAGMKISAQHFVDVAIPYCDVSRVEVLLNGRPYGLQCEKQEHYIFNRSKCNRIELNGQ